MPIGITAYEKTTALEISGMWKTQGYETRIKTIKDGTFLVIRGDEIKQKDKNIYDTHQEATRVSDKLYFNGIPSEIVKLDNGKYQVLVKTSSKN